jgi:hypothetical protein
LENSLRAPPPVEVVALAPIQNKQIVFYWITASAIGEAIGDTSNEIKIKITFTRD